MPCTLKGSCRGEGAAGAMHLKEAGAGAAGAMHLEEECSVVWVGLMIWVSIKHREKAAVQSHSACLRL